MKNNELKSEKGSAGVIVLIAILAFLIGIALGGLVGFGIKARN